jgi:hypothetical protein
MGVDDVFENSGKVGRGAVEFGLVLVAMGEDGVLVSELGGRRERGGDDTRSLARRLLEDRTWSCESVVLVPAEMPKLSHISILATDSTCTGTRRSPCFKSC